MKQISVTLQIPADVEKLVQKDAKKQGFSRSDWIRIAINDKLLTVRRTNEVKNREILSHY